MIRAPETTESVFSEINITPFTDVLLVLLIIFLILAALVVPPGFEKQLGCGTCAHPSPIRQRNDVVVGISQSGIISVNGVRTTEAGLYDVLNRVAAGNHRAKVQLIADARARYGLVVRVLDAAKAAALSDVSFVTQ